MSPCKHQSLAITLKALPEHFTMPSTQFNFEEKYRYQNGFASYHE